ncbi:cytochrome c biogenesis CcdA family protein [Pseudanabaena sp. UWO310]|uniref:cytochrome c biogenesis CcdA family protein n=1 Tax=Pseudanabaena sp. UWO310 TaxID=2480795 RepID=UPI001157C494|nr:cytochrome c biogenesis protein CcdA [Pseudanabaena sp. UWO310]TYQ30065.1 cytochrome c biogenesis protein CcdA [Pseudanabaena sp. UWO310]
MTLSLSLLSIGLALLGGLLTALSPCILPILPIIVGRSLQTHRYAPLTLVGGLISGFAVAGSLLGIASNWLTGFSNFARIIAIAFLLGLGLLSIFPRWNYLLVSKISSKFPVFKVKESTEVNLFAEFWLGTQLGLLWTPCAGSVLGSILILAAAKHEILTALILLLVYGLGTGIPILLLAYASRYFSNSFLKLRSHSQFLQKLGGVLISITAIAIILGWDVKLQIWLAPFFPVWQL